jgi:deoxyribodipyrimidine photo-lyase
MCLPRAFRVSLHFRTNLVSNACPLSMFEHRLCYLSKQVRVSLSFKSTSSYQVKHFSLLMGTNTRPRKPTTAMEIVTEPIKKVVEAVEAVAVGSKRKASTSLGLNGNKKSKITSASTDPLRQPHDRYRESEEHGIVLRDFYPHEMNNARALAYNSDQLPRPIELLESALRETAADRAKIQVKDAVVHWYKCDLRTGDNKALHLASQKAQEKNLPLICIYIVSPQDFEAHLTAPVRVDFILRTLQILKEDLAKLDIPLYVETMEKRQAIPGRILELLQEWGASHLFANMEYEVDELRREARMVRSCLERGICMEVVHDTCVVEPGVLKSGAGKQYSVYSPWFRSWVAFIHGKPDLLDLFDPPVHNPETARLNYAKLFDCRIPDAPANKTLTDEEKARFRSMWPCGEHEAHERLIKFAENRIKQYGDRRNFPADTATSSLSVHLASGTLSARTAVHTAREYNTTRKLDGGIPGIVTWISEVAWRDFYKHVLAHWPYVW